jgi:hypothetical protein
MQTHPPVDIAMICVLPAAGMAERKVILAPAITPS